MRFSSQPKNYKIVAKENPRRGGGVLLFTMSEMNELLDTKVGHEKLDLYLSTSSYCVEKQVLINLSVVSIKSGGKNLVKVYCY